MPEVLALANLDFENELAGSTKPLPAAQLARWRYILRLLPESRQAHCLDPANPAWPHAGQRLVVWGVTPRVLALARQLGLEGDFPPVEAVRTVNDKRFSHRLEKQWNLALPYSQVVKSEQQFEEAAGACPHDWVLKHPLGFSGRERVLGKAGRLSPSARGWARRKFGQGWSLLFEPWVEDRRDFSCHFDIGPDGRVHYRGTTRLLSDASGIYRGNRFLPGPSPALEERVALECARQGYWGPLGVDGFTGRLGEQSIVRPLVEINARMSFGRLTLALSEWLPPGWCYTWLHPQTPEPALPPPRPEPGRYSLPLAADPDRQSGTVLIVAPTPSSLTALGG